MWIWLFAFDLARQYGRYLFGVYTQPYTHAVSFDYLLLPWIPLRHQKVKNWRAIRKRRLQQVKQGCKVVTNNQIQIYSFVAQTRSFIHRLLESFYITHMQNLDKSQRVDILIQRINEIHFFRELNWFSIANLTFAFFFSNSFNAK